VRIGHVKRPTNSTVKRMVVARAGNRQIGMRAPSLEPGRLRANRATPANRVHATTVLGERSSTSSVVVLSTPTDAMGFRKSTRDVKAQSAAKEHTTEAQGGSGGPGVRRPGAGLGQRSYS